MFLLCPTEPWLVHTLAAKTGVSRQAYAICNRFAVKIQPNWNVRWTSFSEWFHSMTIFSPPSHNTRPYFRNFVWPVINECFQRMVYINPVKTQQPTKAKNCDSLVFGGWAAWKVDHFSRAQKDARTFHLKGGRVISVFSDGNCNIYMEGAFVCLSVLFFNLHPPLIKVV